jgi:hypothetical protein
MLMSMLTNISKIRYARFPSRIAQISRLKIPYHCKRSFSLPVNCWLKLVPSESNISVVPEHLTHLTSCQMFHFEADICSMLLSYSRSENESRNWSRRFGLVRGIIRHARYPLCCLSPAGVMYSHRIVLLVLTIA